MKTKTEKGISLEDKINIIFQKEDTKLSIKTKTLIDEMLIDKEQTEIMIDIIIKRASLKKNNPSILDGFIYQKVIKRSDDTVKSKLILNLPNGLLNLETFTEINYEPLQKLLIHEKFQEADIITQQNLCKLVTLKTNNKRDWLYFTDIQFLPKKDVYIIDLLWKIYSQGKFGFSIQKSIWLNNKKKWDTLWEKIDWSNNNIMRRYPKEFLWTVEAPEGHLPLFNQLRGTQALASLFNHIDW
uniref:GUN4-like domain-containing protein n=1 Tax=Polysiphonia urceolata TaxID=173545 RepID=A0A1Z1MBV5_POLUR|nr:hypothetical protein [Polysiphonia stricta]ARW63439.1 hypothetical protein [Polysiphonia stricta]